MVFSYIFLNYGCEEKRGKCVMEDSFVLKLKNRKFSEFYLCFCGRARCEPLHSYGPAVRPNYLIHIILEGQGRYVVDGEEYDLRAGQGFLIEPDQQTFYQADERTPGLIYGLVLTVPEPGSILLILGWEKGREPFIAGRYRNFRQCFWRLWREIRTPSKMNF